MPGSSLRVEDLTGVGVFLTPVLVGEAHRIRYHAPMSPYPRPTIRRPRSGVAGMGDLLNVKRAGAQHPWLPIRTLPAQGLADLADLGDTQDGPTGYSELIAALKNNIFSKAGAGMLGTANATSGLGNLINLAGIIFDRGSQRHPAAGCPGGVEPVGRHRLARRQRLEHGLDVRPHDLDEQGRAGVRGAGRRGDGPVQRPTAIINYTQ